MVKKVMESGLLFNFTMPSLQIRQEIYIPLLWCLAISVLRQKHATLQTARIQPAVTPGAQTALCSEHTPRDFRAAEKSALIVGNRTVPGRFAACPVGRGPELQRKQLRTSTLRSQPANSNMQAVQSKTSEDATGLNMAGLSVSCTHGELRSPGELSEGNNRKPEASNHSEGNWAVELASLPTMAVSQQKTSSL